MNRIRRIRRITAAIAGLAATWLGLAAAAPAAFAEQASPPGASGPVIVTRTVIVGGMPGWQIALIAVGAALVAAALAVLADRAWTARHSAIPAAA